MDTEIKRHRRVNGLSLGLLALGAISTTVAFCIFATGGAGYKEYVPKSKKKRTPRTPYHDFTDTAEGLTEIKYVN